MQPKVSVIIPVYNAEKYLAGCLNSVINQTLAGIEIICVEDGSTDNSKKILAEYEKADSRIRVIWHSNNMGIVTTRKHGVLAAQGQYIMFLDSDDELFSHACETAYTAIEKNKTDVLEFGGLTVNIAARTVSVDGKRVELTPKEYDLLFYLIENKNIALSRNQLLQDIWGYDFFGDTRTVDIHITKLRKKIEDDPSHPKLLVTFRGEGYQMRSAPECDK